MMDEIIFILRCTFIVLISISGLCLISYILYSIAINQYYKGLKLTRLNVSKSSSTNNYKIVA